MRLWRRSLLFRSVAGVTALTLVLVGAIFLFMVASVSQQLFDNKLAEVLEASSRASDQAQASLSSSTVTDEKGIQNLKTSVITNTVTISSADGVGLLRSPNTANIAGSQDISSSGFDEGDVPDSLRAAVRADPGVLYWQSIRVSATGEPGIVVGVTQTIPVAGQHELYLVYSLDSESATLAFVQRILGIGGGLLVVLAAVATLLAVWYVLRPVITAARTSRRLAAGDLDQRVPVHGEDEGAVLARSFNLMADAIQEQITQLAQLSTMQQRFVSDVSHELRTPLTTIKLASDVVYADRDQLSPAARRSAELLSAQVARFEQLLADLLEVSRHDADAASLTPVTFDLRGLVERVAAGLQQAASEQGTAIEVRGAKAAAVLTADAKRIERILNNLLANAIEHSGGLPISVWVKKGGGAVAVAVRDFGPGIQPEHLDLVFERFWRADPSRKRTLGGTGLGLSIAREDAELHGGRLEVWSRPGEGACFRLTVPVLPGQSFARSPLRLPPTQARPAAKKKEADA